MSFLRNHIFMIFIFYVLLIFIFGILYQCEYKNNDHSFLFNSDIETQQKLNYNYELNIQRKKLLDSLSKCKIKINCIQKIKDNFNVIEFENKLFDPKSKQAHYNNDDTIIAISKDNSNMKLLAIDHTIYTIAIKGFSDGIHSNIKLLFIEPSKDTFILYDRNISVNEITSIFNRNCFIEDLFHEYQNLKIKLNIEFENIGLKFKEQKIWNYWDFLYFSTITITTTGFGDIIPNNTYIRILVMFEIFIGLILTVFALNLFVNQKIKKE